LNGKILVFLSKNILEQILDTAQLTFFAFFSFTLTKHLFSLLCILYSMEPVSFWQGQDNFVPLALTTYHLLSSNVIHAVSEGSGTQNTGLKQFTM